MAKLTLPAGWVKCDRYSYGRWTTDVVTKSLVSNAAYGYSIERNRASYEKKWVLRHIPGCSFGSLSSYVVGRFDGVLEAIKAAGEHADSLHPWKSVMAGLLDYVR